MAIFSRFLFILSLLVTFIFFIIYGRNSSTFYGDSLGYYSYLPSAFIYHNFDRIDSIPETSKTDTWVIGNIKNFVNYGPKTEKGFHINQYTYGVALMELPFFALAHLYEYARGFPMNGYSDSYNIALKLCSISYALIGLFFTFLILKRFVPKTIGLITISLLLLASNIFWFAVFQAGMAHLTIFMLYAIVIWSTICIYENPKWIYFIFIGLAGGLIVVMRPSDIILMLFPLLYKVYSKESLMQKIVFIRTHWIKIVVMLACAFLPVFPQLLFWKIYSGHWIYDNYTAQSFVWSFKNLPKGLLSSSNGWLFYSKIMFAALAGLFFYRKQKDVFLSIVIVMPLYIFIIYSWWCWNYINGFGSRPMIHLYPLLAIPLAFFIDWIATQKKWVVTLFVLFCSFCVYSNIRWSTLQHNGYLITEHNYKGYANMMLFKYDNDYRSLVINDFGKQPDYSVLKTGKTLTEENFNYSDSVFIKRDTDSTDYFLKVAEGTEYPPAKLIWLYNPDEAKPESWLRISGNFMGKHEWVDTYWATIMLYEVKNRGVWQAVKITNKIGRENERAIQLHSGVENKWGEVFFYGQIPSEIQKGDTISVTIWNTSKEEIWIDDLKIQSTVPK